MCWAPPWPASDSLRVLAGLEPPNPSSFSNSAGAAVWSMIPLIITATLSPHLSSSQLAQPGAALCRLPLQIRTPLVKLFTHLSSPQAPLHFVCPLKDPIEGKITFFFSKMRNNTVSWILLQRYLINLEFRVPVWLTTIGRFFIKFQLQGLW